MIDKFTAPKTKEEFLARVGEITEAGARSVSQGLDVQIKKKAGALLEEKRFFDDIVTYHQTGKFPERLNTNEQRT